MPNRCTFGVGRDLCRLMSVHKAGLYKASEAFEKGFERGFNVSLKVGIFKEPEVLLTESRRRIIIHRSSR
jgi:hypothetical protein